MVSIESGELAISEFTVLMMYRFWSCRHCRQQNALPDSVQAQPELEEGFKEIIESICDDLAKYDENDGFEEFAPITAAEEEPKEMDQTDR